MPKGNRDQLPPLQQLVHGKKLPILVLDERWHKLFPGGVKPEEVKTLEKKCNELLKEQGKLVNEIKDLRRGKKKLIDAIVSGMNEGENDRKKEKQKKLLIETKQKIEEESDRLMEVPYEIRKTNEELLVVSITYCYDKLKEREEYLQELTQDIEVQRAEIKQKEAELNALKTQIKPHYLYNTLDIIRMTAMKHEDRETAEMLESLARQLRYLMGEEKEMVSLEQELDNIRDYFQMMRIRYEGRISLNITVPESLREIAVLKLLVQPAVENAVKHGLKEKDGQGSVWISANRKAEKVEVTVMDDGVGMDTEQLEAIRKRISAGTKELHNPEKGGVGLVNVNERIQNRYGCQYGVQIESTKGAGTIVIICIPYLSEGEKDV